MKRTVSCLLGLAGCFLVPVSISAQQDDDDQQVEEIIVTGARVTQGGAQDIKFFRGEVEQARIPHPDTFTAEGLLSEHDIIIPAELECAQLFCLVGESIKAELVAQPEAGLLVGLGFATNIDGEEWVRAPLNLVAVVDKSGSMRGHPLEMVKIGLAEAAKQLKPEDQLTIVLYGDRSYLHMEPTRATKANRAAILASIKQIESAGSTNMEEGLQIGYGAAFGSEAEFEGATRVMLFTDERPNVGRTDPQSFMGMAQAGSIKGIGLTTIGVGVQFGAELATEISSVRGGNLFFVRGANDATTLFRDELDFMVSELAFDLKLTITPHPDYKIAGVYGIPGDLLGWQNERTVEVTIPTVFLSSKGGAILFSLAGNLEDSFLPGRIPADGQPLAKVDLVYKPATGPEESAGLEVTAPSGEASDGMRLAHVLIDEFTVLHLASSEHYLNNNQEKAFQLVQALSSKLQNFGGDALEPEREMVGQLEARFAFLSGHGSEVAASSANFMQLWGSWEVVRVRGDVNLSKGDKLVFTPENELEIYKIVDGNEEFDDSEDYRLNDQQIYLEDSDLTFEYKAGGQKLELRHQRDGVTIRLRRSALSST